jgi:hypothetical protein
MFKPSACTIAAAFFLVLGGCSRHAEPPAVTAGDAAASATVARAAAVDPGIPVPAEEPSEAVLEKLVRQWYDEAADSGALTFVSASGKKTSLRPKIHSARKLGCKRPPRTPEGDYDCDLLLSLSLMGDAPSDHGQSISVKWDAKEGEWVGQWGGAGKRR